MKIRAFVFDDNRELRSLLTSILTNRGYEVIPYEGPTYCPVYLDKKRTCPHDHPCVDIIVTDMQMPNVTGLEFIENQVEKNCRINIENVALMSGTWKEEELERIRRLGCKVFEKPFFFEQFEKWLDECEKRIDPKRKLAKLPGS